MVTFPVKIVGLKDNIAVVTPMTTAIVAAFAPFGISLNFYAQEELPLDPSADTWPDLISRLHTESAAQQNIHLLLVDQCPCANTAINGQLMDPEYRSIAAVFFCARLFWENNGNPASNADRVAQVCIHELGHIFNLVHGDGNSSSYSNAILQATDRDGETPETAWTAAVAEAVSNNEVPLVAPVSPNSYPFSSSCRAYLRDMTAGSQWWPFQNDFRDSGDSVAELGDQLLTLNVTPKDRISRIHIGGEIYFTLSITNLSDEEVQISSGIGPNYGSLRVHILHKDGNKTVYRPVRHTCSHVQQRLAPGQSIFRSFALSGTLTSELTPGTHTCVVALNDSACKAKGSTSFKVIVTHHESLRKKSDQLRRYVAAERKTASYARDVAGLPENSPLAAQFKLEHAIRSKRVKARQDMLRDCQRTGVPRALRHAAARHEFLQRIVEGQNVEAVLKELRGRFRSVRDAELFEVLKHVRLSASHSTQGRTR